MGFSNLGKKNGGFAAKQTKGGRGNSKAMGFGESRERRGLYGQKGGRLKEAEIQIKRQFGICFMCFLD